MKKDQNGSYVPDWDSCKTVAQLQQEFNEWIKHVSQEAFSLDKRIKVNDPKFNDTYTKRYINHPREFYVISTSTGNTPYYYGINNTLLKKMKEYNRELSSKKQSLRMESFMKDTEDVAGQIKTGINGTYVYDQEARNTLKLIAEEFRAGKITEKEKQDRISAFNKKYSTAISLTANYKQLNDEATKTTGGIVNKIESEVSNLKQSLEGTYVYSEAARKELQKIADDYEIGKITEDEKKAKIIEFNKKYNANISDKAEVQTIRSAANKKNGILSVTGTDIEAKIKEETARLTNLSHFWDNSNNETVKKFTDQGITGDVMWGVIWGKYNKDDAARQDLEKLADLVSAGKGSSPEAIALRNKINEKYQLNLADNVTAADIAKVIESDKKYTYKKTVRKIAESIIEDKLNEQIKKRLEEIIGGKLEDWGIEFKDNQIISTLRDVIRGHKTAFFNQEKFLKKLQKELETKIDKLIEEKVFKLIDEQAKKINSQIDDTAKKVIDMIDPYRKKVDQTYEKLDTWLKSPASAKETIAKKLDEMLKSPVDSIAAKLDSFEPFKKFGITLGLGDMFKTVSQQFTKGMAERIYQVTKPLVESALKIVTQVKTAINKLIDTVNKIKEKAKQLVEKWKNAIKDAVKDFTKKMVNEIIKFVRVSFSDLGVGGISSLI